MAWLDSGNTTREIKWERTRKITNPFGFFPAYTQVSGLRLLLPIRKGITHWKRMGLPRLLPGSNKAGMIQCKKQGLSKGLTDTEEQCYSNDSEAAAVISFG